LVTLIVIIVASWIIAAAFTGVGVGRVIARADSHHERSELSREHRGTVTP
jgi:putative effector of murein hydrolase LrgA (UPF0299 family)